VVLAAFLIEIRKALQVELQAKANALLIEILGAMSNSSRKIPPASSFVPPPSLVWVNSLWFLSLVLSLVASLGAVLAKIWITQYALSIEPQGTPKRVRYSSIVATWGLNDSNSLR
jgi:hypothetical protein